MSQQSDPWDTFNATGQSQANPAVAVAVEPTPAPAPEPEDKRQRWTCVDPLGPRTLRRQPGAPPGDAGTPCPVFHSDDHMAKRVVVCPNCGGVSVRHAFTGEV